MKLKRIVTLILIMYTFCLVIGCGMGQENVVSKSESCWNQYFYVVLSNEINGISNTNEIHIFLLLCLENSSDKDDANIFNFYDFLHQKGFAH